MGVQYFEEWGNARANAYYEANLPPNVKKPTEADSVRVCEKYIRDKYEHKRFIAKTIPPKMARTEQEEAPAPEPVAARRTSTGPALKPVTRREQQQPSAAATPVATPTPAPAVSLLDFDSEPVTPISPPVVQQQQFQQPAFQPQQQFSNFDEPPKPPAVSLRCMSCHYGANSYIYSSE